MKIKYIPPNLKLFAFVHSDYGGKRLTLLYSIANTTYMM